MKKKLLQIYLIHVNQSRILGSAFIMLRKVVGFTILIKFTHYIKLIKVVKYFLCVQSIFLGMIKK